MNKPIAVVLGATGGVGHWLVRELVAQGFHVRATSRSEERLYEQFGDLDIEFCTGNPTQVSFIKKVSNHADVVFHAIGLPFPQWDEVQIPLMKAILTGITGRAKRLVLVHPVYAYGFPISTLVTEEHPTSPATKKGQIRKQMEQMLMDAHYKNEVEGVIARLPDFYGPYAQNSYLNFIFRSMMRKKRAFWLGPLEIEREYVFVPDAAKALVPLATKEGVAGEAWNIPGGGGITGKEVIQIASKHLNVSPKVTQVHKWMLRLLGIVDSTMREIVELYYLYDRPFFLSGEKYEQQVGKLPRTPYSTGIFEMIQWMQHQT